jgi:hypothetical protein
MRFLLAKARPPSSMRRKSQATLANLPLQLTRAYQLSVEVQ